MNREIKFRGNNGKEWLVGDLVHRDGNVYIFPYEGWDSYDGYKVDPSTVGQYTGLKDKDGKEIWEGDVANADYLREEKAIGIIEFRKGQFVHNGKGDKTKQVVGWADIKSDTIEVIGNIHDNPELCQS